MPSIFVPHAFKVQRRYKHLINKSIVLIDKRIIKNIKKALFYRDLYGYLII